MCWIQYIDMNGHRTNVGTNGLADESTRKVKDGTLKRFKPVATSAPQLPLGAQPRSGVGANKRYAKYLCRYHDGDVSFRVSEISISKYRAGARLPRAYTAATEMRVSPGVLELVQIVGEHGLLPVVVHEGVPLADAVELLETPREELQNGQRLEATIKGRGCGTI